MKNVFCSSLSYLLRKMPAAIKARRITSVTLTLLLLLAAVVPVLVNPGFVHADETFTRAADPLSLPAGVENSAAFSLYSSYMALAHTVSPYVNIYQQSLPPAPALTSPDDTATVAGTSITFSWGAVSDATNYAVQVDTEPTFSYPLFHYNYTYGATSKTYTDFPNAGTTYYWRARAYNADGWGDWSSARSFTNGTPPLIPPLVLTLLSPINGATVEATSITFQWSTVSKATNYAVQVDTEPTFSYPLFRYNYTYGATSKTYTDFPNDGTTYYWRARAYNAAGWGAWSFIRSFANGIDPPSAPILILPVNASTAAGASITFWWGPVSGATNYAVQVDTEPTFSYPLFHYNYTSGATSFTYTDFPNAGATYYWRARAYNALGWGDWSSSRSFTNGTPPATPPPAPALTSPDDTATVAGTSITFSWGSVSGATNYAVQVSTSPDFSTLFHYNYTYRATSKTYTDFPNNGTTYYWRARAYNTIGWGDWSTARSLTNDP